MPTTTLRLVTSIDDLPFIADLIHESKLALPINRLLWEDWPNNDKQHPQYVNAVEASFKDPLTTIWKVVDDNNESGAIVGYLVFSLKKAASIPVEVSAEELKEKGEPKFPDGINVDVLKAVIAFGEVDTLNDVEHYDIIHIFVKPTYRRQKIGTQLMQKAIEAAGKAGLPLSVSSEPYAHNFFLSQGFEDTKHVDVDLRKFSQENCGYGPFRVSGMVKGLKPSQ